MDTIRPVPKSGQKRGLPATLRVVVATNVKRLMAQRDITSGKSLGKEAGIGKRTAERLLACTVAAQLDTVEAVADALNVPPWELLIDRRQQDSRIMLRGSEPVGDTRQRIIPAKIEKQKAKK